MTFTPSTRSVLVDRQDVSGLDFTAAPADAVAAFVVGLYREASGRGLDVPGYTF